MINAHTKICCMIGNPVTHSLSPQMHNSAYQELGLDYVFSAFTVVDVEKALLGVRALGITGVVVTIPHKQNVMKYLNYIDKTAQKIGAVNTIVNDNGILKGTNTDWIGAVESLKSVTDIKGKTVAILGAGGASRAVIYGVQHEKGEVVLFNRTRQKAKQLAEEFNIRLVFDLTQTEKMREVDIIINTTSVGMEPHDDESPIEQNAIHAKQLVYDIVYTPRVTKLLQLAQRQKARILTGETMVLYGGVKQFELFTKHKAPIEVMRKALC